MTQSNRTGDDAKSWATLQAEFALRGFQVARSDAHDGPVVFFLTISGIGRQVRSMDEAWRVLEHLKLTEAA